MSVAASVLSTVVLLAWDPGPNWFHSLTFVGYYLGTVVSGNAHSPNMAVAYVAIWAMVFVPIWTAVAFVSLAYRDVRDDIVGEQ